MSCNLYCPVRVQEAKEKEKKLQKAAKEAADASGINIEELQLKLVKLEADKKKEEELRNYMQLERVCCLDCIVLFFPCSGHHTGLLPCTVLDELACKYACVCTAAPLSSARSHLSALSPALTRAALDPQQDKVSAFWDITKRELESGRAELRSRERDIEDLQEQHQTELKASAPFHSALRPLAACWLCNGMPHCAWHVRCRRQALLFCHPACLHSACLLVR